MRPRAVLAALDGARGERRQSVRLSVTRVGPACAARRLRGTMPSRLLPCPAQKPLLSSLHPARAPGSSPCLQGISDPELPSASQPGELGLTVASARRWSALLLAESPAPSIASGEGQEVGEMLLEQMDAGGGE